MEQNNRYVLIRKIYLYLFSLVGLVLIVIATVRLVDLGLRVYVFKGADEAVIWPQRPVKLTPEGQETQLTPEEEENFRQQEREAQMRENQRQRQRTASNSTAMILVGLPLYLYHWRIIKRET
jgi:hypothetical protein